ISAARVGLSVLRQSTHLRSELRRRCQRKAPRAMGSLCLCRTMRDVSVSPANPHAAARGVAASWRRPGLAMIPERPWRLPPSDALSSVAYATDAMLQVLVPAGVVAIAYGPWLALAIAALLLIVAFSYRQTIHAYPQGGGAYIVAKDNLGTTAGLVAAVALLV